MIGGGRSTSSCAFTPAHSDQHASASASARARIGRSLLLRARDTGRRQTFRLGEPSIIEGVAQRLSRQRLPRGSGELGSGLRAVIRRQKPFYLAVVFLP